MDRYSILDQGSSSSAADVPPSPASYMRFPGEDGGKSLAEMAQRDLKVALQLLAERAQYITGASGAAIALREDEELICRARAGPSAPEVGAQLQVSTGLTGESVRTREILRCNDAGTDTRVNRESCQALGIASVMVMPLLREQEVIGVFELLSDRIQAFEERDVVALQRLGEMIGTAIEHADAVKRGIQPVSAQLSLPQETSAPSQLAAPELALETGPPHIPQATGTEALRPKSANIRTCQACGFPVSGSRTICLDCEAAQDSQEQLAPGSTAATPAFLAELGNTRNQSWMREHIYTIGIVLMVVLTVGLLLWLRPI